MSTKILGTQQPSHNENNPLKCSTCTRTFTRQEHLRRHELTHSNDKPFKCATCGRQFVRKDALDRHEVTHQATGPTLRQKGARACTNCATAKSKCSGELPTCSRCRKRGEIRCDYPDTSVLLDGPPHVDDTRVHTSEYSMIQHRPSQESAEDQNILNHTTNLPPVADISESLHLNHFDESFWGNDFQSTINWLSEDVSAFNDNYNFEGVNDNVLFPGIGSSLISDTSMNGFSVSDQPSMVSPQQTSRISLSSNDTPHSVNSYTTHQQHVDGELYVDGRPARLPRVKRRKLTASISVLTPTQADRYDLALDVHQSGSDVPDAGFLLSDATYNELVHAFHSICFHDQSHVRESDTLSLEANFDKLHVLFDKEYEPNFPSKEVFEMLVMSYVAHFQPVLPIFHPSNLPDLEWQLVIATSAVGALYVKFELSNRYFVSSLHEFLRRILYIGGEIIAWLPTSETTRTQLQLLHAISTAYSPPSRTYTPSRLAVFLPVDYCLTLWKTKTGASEHANHDSVSNRWQRWIEYETSNRLGYAIWLLDTMFAIHFQQRPRLTLEDALANLPCCEKLWLADSADEWLQLHAQTPRNRNLKETLYELYTQKKLNADASEYSRTLLIHGLFHRMWEVEHYFKDSLSQWTPTAQNSAERLPQVDTAVWLPSMPTFARWRNSSCDCIDVLHWSANAAIGAASGMEHPTVLHLHFSRVILLTPYKQIVAVARYVASTESRLSDKEIASDKHIIKRWAMHDQYKARLAMIHAGVLFWHVRRYSTNNFYEPSSVVMSALALWAFSAFSERGRSTERSASQAMDDSQDGSENEESRCEIILLDRPTDDELVQQYVREGHKMRAILNGVGDLHGVNAPARVLNEGRKLLRTLASWGIAGHWIAVFDRLIAISRHQGGLSAG